MEEDYKSISIVPTRKMPSYCSLANEEVNCQDFGLYKKSNLMTIYAQTRKLIQDFMSKLCDDNDDGDDVKNGGEQGFRSAKEALVGETLARKVQAKKASKREAFWL